MKSLVRTLFALGFVLLLSACSHLDLTPPGPAARVVAGVITNNTNAPLPSDTEVTVRVVDTSRGESRPEVLGDQTIQNPGEMPVPFRIEFTAEDALLRRGVNLEARVSIGGKLRYTTITAHPITLANVNTSHVVEVVLAEKR